MNLLTQILSSRVKAEVFRLLFGFADKPLYLRQLERLSGFAVSTVSQELRRLASFGLIRETRDGNRTYYQAAKEHPLYPDIRNIVLKTSGLADLLREALHGQPVDMAFVFGSVARGEERAHSDIDLLVIGSIGLRQLSKQFEGIAEKIGREINPVVLSGEEFRRRLRENDHFLVSVLASPRLFVIGNDHELEAMAGQPVAANAPDESAGNRGPARHC